GTEAQRRAQLQSVLEWLLGDHNEAPIRSETDVSEAVALLQTKAGHAPGFPAAALAQILAVLPRAIPQVAAVLPPLFAFASKEDPKDASVLRFVRVEWPSHLVNALALAFADLPLSPSAHEHLVAKLVNCMKAADSEHLATVVRFLLIQAKVGQRKQILQAILEHVTDLDLQLGSCSDADWVSGTLAKPKKDAIRTEGTLILQICFAVRQNQELGTELLGLLKAVDVTPFGFSLLLAISQIHRFESTALEILKSKTVQACKDFENHHRSQWLPLEAKRTLSSSPTTIWKAIKRIILKSEYWDNLIPELMQFAFLLIEASTAGAQPPNGTHRLVFEEQSDTTVWGLYDLGSWILLEVCVKHDPVVNTVVDQILSRIITKPISIITYSYIFETVSRKSGGGSAVAAGTHRLSQFSPKILEVLQCLGQVPLTVSERFLWSILALFESGSSFRECLVIPLRKGMFSSDLASRKVSVATLVHILKLVDSPAESGSQNMIASNDSEIFYILRRGMNQQYNIRVQLYEGFLSIIELQPWLGSSCLDLFLPQLSRYYQDSKVIRAPLKLESCFEGTVVSEPLPELMSVVMSAIQAARASHRNVTDSVEMFDDIVERLVKADLADFEIDKDADYASEGEESKMNKMTVNILMGVYDVAIEYVMTSEAKTENEIELVLSLFRKSLAVKNFLKDKVKAKKGFGNKNAHIPTSSGLDTRITLLHSLFGKTAIQRLRINSEFTHQIVLDTVSVLHKVTTNFVRASPLLLDQLNALGRVLFCEVLKKTKVALFQAKSAERGVFSAAVEGFEKLVVFVLVSVPDNAGGFLVEMMADPQGAGRGEEEEGESVLDEFVSQVQELICVILDPQPAYTREAVLLIKCLSELWTFLDETASSTNVEYSRASLDRLTLEMQEWALRMWRKYHETESVLSKSLVALFCKMQRRTSDFDALRKLVANIHQSVGLLLDESDDEMSQNMDSRIGEINEKDLPYIISTILSNVDENLDEVKWIVSKLKKGPSENTQVLKVESVIYKNLIGIIRVLYDILRTDLPFEAADIVFVTIIKVFKVVNGLLKYKMGNPENSSGFEELLQVLTDKLRDVLMDLIPTMQDKDSENAVDNTTKKGASLLFKKRKRSERESKTMPTLIFETEQFDRYLIALHKKARGMNLMKYVKRSTARDFKIQEKKLVDKEDIKKEKKVKQN
ncbi:hypothetical protein HDU98_000281, partial [Podochytrium sp. JEL0797]